MLSNTIQILDTTVLFNLLDVPNRAQQHNDTLSRLESFIKRGDTLLLPMAAVYETGNHIAQQGDGTQRRNTAGRFVDLVKKAIDNESPFSLAKIHDIEDLRKWLTLFPKNAQREIGLCDLSIIQICQKQRQLNKKRSVFIWSYDKHLSSYGEPSA